MKTYLKYASCFFATVALSGCITTNNHDVRQANGANAGELIIFTGDQAETVGVFINDKFIAALPSQHKVVHGLCNGEYQLKIRSVSAPSNKRKQVTQTVAEQSINIVAGQTQYYQVQHAGKGWNVTQTSTLPEGLKQNDDKLVRRMPDAMLKCE